MKKTNHHKHAEKHLKKAKMHSEKAAKHHDLAHKSMEKVGALEKAFKAHENKDTERMKRVHKIEKKLTKSGRPKKAK